MNKFSMLHDLDLYLQKDYSSFHTPSHKSNKNELDKLFKLLSYDLTELEDTGSLFDGEGMTAKAEHALRRLYNTNGSYFSTGGCTLAIQAMLRLAMPEGGTLLSGRVIHRSAINTMALLGIDPIWILPDNTAKNGFSGRISADDIRQAIENNKDIKAVYITSPDYFGVISDVSEISKVCKNFNIPLLVDNAHGSHLKWLKQSQHPIDLGATMCADSAHKTLPVLTGGAFLHIMDEKYIDFVRSAMSLFGSTSPSYPIMASLDLCRQWLETKGPKAYEDLSVKVQDIKRLFIEANFVLPSGELDPCRISVKTNGYKPKNQSLASFFKSFKIEPEYANDDTIILIFSPFNTDKDFERLKTALKEYKKLKFEKTEKPLIKNSLPIKKMQPRQALLKESEILPIDTALNRISAEAACLCPPGIPIISHGEIIDANIIKNLKTNGIKKIKVIRK